MLTVVKAAAIDCTNGSSTKACDRFDVKSYPTFMYFSSGVKQYQYTERGRLKDDFMRFMLEPKAPPPPPGPWSDETGGYITHLTEAKGFNRHVAKTEATLVMFYAPWCAHCKAAKPEFVMAAKAFHTDPGVSFAGVDCTLPESKKTCDKYKVASYP